MKRSALLIRAVMVFVFAALGLSAQGFAQPNNPQSQYAQIKQAFGPPIRVVPGELITDITPHTRFAREFSGPVTLANVSGFAQRTRFSQTDLANYGSPGTRFMVVVALTNAGDQTVETMLLTKRAGLPELTFAELKTDRIDVLRDRGDADLGEHLRAHHSFGCRVVLNPDQTRYFIVTFKGVHSSFVPLTVGDADEIMRQQHLRNAMIVACAASMLVLMLVAALFYFVTAGRHFLWLAIAEFASAAFVVHVNGYSIHYWLFDKGIWIYSIGWIMPCVYGLALVQFTRGLLDTSHSLPRLDRLLNGLAILLAATLALTLIAAILSSEWLLSLAGYPVPVSLTIYTYGLPFVGAIAVARIGRQYTPLFIAWLINAAFNTYFTMAMLDLGVRLPFDSYFFAPIGVVVSLLMTLTMVLHMRKVMQDKQQSETDLIASLEDRLSLSEEKAEALATINDQDQLIHASGHDSQQVMMALNAVVEFAKSNEQADLPPVLTRTLQASVSQLQDIADTTMAGPFSTGDSQALVLLGRFELHDLLRQAEMIYRPIAHQKGLTLTIDDPGAMVLISDRAICARVVSNLLNNSIKYTDKGSVQLRVAVVEGALEIALHDTGRGMTKEFSDRLLALKDERLRADTEVEGTGSGFAAANKAVQKLGGTISIHSSLGEGTCVIVTIPAVSSAPQCSLEAFAGEARALGLELVDYDALDAPGNADEQSSASAFLPISAHPTAAARNRISHYADIALLKPLSLDMLDHPLIPAPFINSRTASLERA